MYIKPYQYNLLLGCLKKPSLKHGGMHRKAGILSPNTTKWHHCHEINACKINKSILNCLGLNGIIPQIQKAVFTISSFTVHLINWLYCIFSAEYLLKIFLLLWIHCRYVSKLTAKNNNSLSIYTFLDSLNWHYYYYFTCKATKAESTYVTCTCSELPDSCFSWYPSSTRTRPWHTTYYLQLVGYYQQPRRGKLQRTFLFKTVLSETIQSIVQCSFTFRRAKRKIRY